jgi:hypothetical protein
MESLATVTDALKSVTTVSNPAATSYGSDDLDAE